MSLAFGFALPHWQAISGGFSPQSLFTGGVQGVLFDISDLSTLFTTSAGTTPATMPGLGSAVSVGLMLDKSQGLVLGPELVTNGDFSGGTTTGWTDISGGILSIDNGRLKITNGVANTGGAYQSISTVAGGLYKIRITCTAGNTVGRLLLGTSVAGTQIYANFNFLGTLDFYFVAQSTTTWITLRTSSFTAGEFVFFDDITVRELPGNHAISFNDTTARPELRARVNLLERSEEFNDTYWSKDGVTVSGNSIIAPNGTLTADKVVKTAVSSNFGVYRDGNQGAGVFTHSVFAKAGEYSYLVIRSSPTINNYATAIIDLVAGQVTQQNNAGTSSATYSVTSVGDGWWKITQSVTNSTAGSSSYSAFSPFNQATGTPGSYGNFNFTGDGTSGIYIWGADLRPANIGANVPAYQRIADANTYDTSGFPLYLRFDGIDDSMYTPANLNLSGTDKVAVFAGVRKNADAASGQIFTELSSSFGSNNGSFGLLDVGAPNYTPGFGSRGTATAYPYPSSGYSAPLSMVLTGIGNIAAPLAQIRANGSVAASSTASQGTGNFGTYPLYIGARNNSSLWFNGHLYSLAVVGNTVSAGNIAAMESWVAGKTGIAI